MTYKELVAVLKMLSIPIAYRTWIEGEEPQLPYILYYKEGSDDLFADNINYFNIDEVSIELYTENKDFALEKQLTNLLKEYELPYESYESYLESEKMYEVLYEIQI